MFDDIKHEIRVSRLHKQRQKISKKYGDKIKALKGQKDKTNDVNDLIHERHLNLMIVDDEIADLQNDYLQKKLCVTHCLPHHTNKSITTNVRR